jgi:hypothetical protein
VRSPQACPGGGSPLDQADYFIIRDILDAKKGSSSLDFYIETPGGSGETAEDIVKYLHGNFGKVSFVVSGEAKSAGTIMVLSGDEILMTETGSLGPIDAQTKIGRSVVSASDYLEWIDDKRKEATKSGSLNPFDAIMIAQLSPGEVGGVGHAFKFAQDLVVDWLTNYKFKNWNVTETRKIPVTLRRKRARAAQIARILCKHSKWRSHGRSIKINDLEGIGLKIISIDNDPTLADIVYRIQTVCRLIFDSSNTFKIIATADAKIAKAAMPAGIQSLIPVMPPVQQQVPDVIHAQSVCPKCGVQHKIYLKFTDNPEIDKNSQSQGWIPYPKDDKIKCNCGFEIDLAGIKNQIELQTGRKIIK